MSNQPDDAQCVSIRTYIKDRDFSSRRLESIPAVTPSSGPSPRHPERRSGDVLFDGVSKREILTEQLSPAGIMWADGRREIRLPWNFRRTRYCSERERRGARRGRCERGGQKEEDGRRVTQGIYRANFTIPDTMVPRRHWPCLTAVPLPLPYRSLHRLGICICIGSISYSAVTHVGRRCVLVCRVESEVINETARNGKVFA